MRTLIKILAVNEPKLVWLAGLLLVASFMLYGFLVNQAIMNVLARGALEKQVPDLRTEVGQLESTYLTLKNKITFEFAVASGYKEVFNPTFISRKSLGQALSLNNEI